jgi:hypothetical protein
MSESVGSESPRFRSRIAVASSISLIALVLAVSSTFRDPSFAGIHELLALPFDPNSQSKDAADSSGVSYLAKVMDAILINLAVCFLRCVDLFQAILNEMTEDPTAPKGPNNDGSFTIDLAQKTVRAKDGDSAVVPSKMVALLHKALLEQKHDEANQRNEYEKDQRDLKQQEATVKRSSDTKKDEDPNIELARYIEEEERATKISAKGHKISPPLSQSPSESGAPFKPAAKPDITKEKIHATASVQLRMPDVPATDTSWTTEVIGARGWEV